MSINEIWLVGGMFLVTFLVRYLPFGLAGSLKIPEPLEQALKYVPVSVLMAIVAPAILIQDGLSIQIHYENHYLMGGIGALMAGFWKKNLLFTIVVGIVVFYSTRLLLVG
jgi:branched-subunit amino acid transport protein